MALLAALAGLLLWLFAGGGPPAQVPAAAAPAAPEDPPGRAPFAPRAAAAAEAPAQRRASPSGEPAPVIDEVAVEKAEVCEGEENLVAVRAHTVNGTDAWLHFTVGGQAGARVPLRAWLDEGGRPPRLEVTAFGRGNAAATAEIPPYEVKRCQPARSALVTARLRANTWSEFDFEARMVEMGSREERHPKPFRPRSWHWSFGDGATVATAAPFATHSYQERPQRGFYSQFLVSVEIRGDGGEPVVGRTALQLMNPAFESREKGVVALMAELTPRFPELSADGVVRQTVRLWHAEERPVFVDRLTVATHLAAGAGGSPPEQADPQETLGSRRIPPGRGLAFDVALDIRARPDVFSVDYLLEGETEGGSPARGGFSLMRPPPRPTREAHQPVADPLLKAKILAAREILGQEYVTDEDLWRLEREGRFANLKVEVPNAAAPGVAGKPSPEPDPGLPPPGPRAPGGAERVAPPKASTRPAPN